MFGNISNIKTSKDKKIFIEKIKIFVTLINLSVEQLKLNTSKVSQDVDILTNIRLNELEVFDGTNSHKLLKKLLSEDLYHQFIRCINLNIAYQNKTNKYVEKLDPIQRYKINQKQKTKTKFNLVDLFCGAGGLSLGFTYENFNIELANDIDDECIETYKYNHPEIMGEKLIKGDIRNLVKELERYNLKEIDVVAGGPPCQGFSSANQQRIIDDPRNELYKYFIKAVEKIVPKFVVMENVKGMLPYADQVVDDLKKVVIYRRNRKFFYDVKYKILSSNNFEVAQKRQRLFFIAVRDDICRKYNVSASIIFDRMAKKPNYNKCFILKDALSFIKPLEAPNIKNMTEIDDEITGKKIDLNKFNGSENLYLKLINNKKFINIIGNHKARYTNDINRKIYNSLDQGDDGTSSKIEDIMPYKHRNHIFKDKYFKLEENKPSRTITAHLKMDCHSHIHPTQVRSITPREAARIQSFPDDYLFLGPYLKTYMQIGNAVPPLMAKSIAREIRNILS